MQDKEIILNLLDNFAAFQKIVESDDAKKEAEYYYELTKAKLEAVGIVTSDLHISKKNTD